MKVTINVQTGKGNKSTTKEINKTADILEEIMTRTDKMFKGYKWKDCICSHDGTQIVLEKQNYLK